MYKRATSEHLGTFVLNFGATCRFKISHLDGVNRYHDDQKATVYTTRNDRHWSFIWAASCATHQNRFARAEATNARCGDEWRKGILTNGTSWVGG